MNNSPHDPRGPPPPHPPHPPQGFMQPHNPRINPRMAGPNSAIGGGGLQDPRMGPGAHAPPPPPLLAPPRPLQATASATDAITAVLASMTQQNVYDVISSMKALTATDPDRAVSLLAANPQLSHALVQAMLMNNMVDPISLQVTMIAQDSILPKDCCFYKKNLLHANSDASLALLSFRRDRRQYICHHSHQPLLSPQCLPLHLFLLLLLHFIKRPPPFLSQCLVKKKNPMSSVRP